MTYLHRFHFKNIRNMDIFFNKLVHLNATKPTADRPTNWINHLCYPLKLRINNKVLYSPFLVRHLLLMVIWAQAFFILTAHVYVMFLSTSPVIWYGLYGGMCHRTVTGLCFVPIKDLLGHSLIASSTTRDRIHINKKFL